MRASDFLGIKDPPRSGKPNGFAEHTQWQNHRRNECDSMPVAADEQNSTWRQCERLLPSERNVQVPFHFLPPIRCCNKNQLYQAESERQRWQIRGIRMAAFDSRIYMLCARLTFLHLFFSGTNEQTTEETTKKCWLFVYSFSFSIWINFTSHCVCVARRRRQSSSCTIASNSMRAYNKIL